MVGKCFKFQSFNTNIFIINQILLLYNTIENPFQKKEKIYDKISNAAEQKQIMERKQNE